MPNVVIFWDLGDEEDGNVRHIAKHGVSVEEVEEVLLDDANEVLSDESPKLTRNQNKGTLISAD